MSKAIIIMVSGADKEHCEKIKKALEAFHVDCVMRVASAHRAPLKALDIVRQYDGEGWCSSPWPAEAWPDVGNACRGCFNEA